MMKKRKTIALAAFLTAAAVLTLAAPAFASSTTITSKINNLYSLVLGIIKAAGAIVLAWGVFEFATGYIDPDGDTISAGIIMTKSEFDRMYREGKGFSSIWHETGHFHTTKYFLDYLNGDQSRLRSEYIRKNQIPPAEYVADLFSLYYAEREDVFEDFKMRIRARYKLIGLDDNARGAWNELRNRRDALKIIETDEQIEKELCRVCGVSCIEEL